MGKTGQFKTIGRTAIVAAMLIAAWAPMVVDAQRDRGLNQPGATGNRAGVRDPGVNQPGAVGNRGGVDPGFNQPGVVGNVGYAGSARQVRAARIQASTSQGRSATTVETRASISPEPPATAVDRSFSREP